MLLLAIGQAWEDCSHWSMLHVWSTVKSLYHIYWLMRILHCSLCYLLTIKIKHNLHKNTFSYGSLISRLSSKDHNEKKYEGHERSIFSFTLWVHQVPNISQKLAKSSKRPQRIPWETLLCIMQWSFNFSCLRPTYYTIYVMNVRGSQPLSWRIRKFILCASLCVRGF